MTTYVLFAVACGGIAWLTSLYLVLQRRVADVERSLDQQRTSAELTQLRDNVAELLDQLRRAASDAGDRHDGETLPTISDPARAGENETAARWRDEERSAVRLARLAVAASDPPLARPEPVSRAHTGQGAGDWVRANGSAQHAATRDMVMDLAKQGLSAREIARKTHVELGGVELVLRMDGENGLTHGGSRRSAAVTFDRPAREVGR